MTYGTKENTVLDYHSFGMLMPDRNSSTSEYRYGFQGQEKDDEIKGEGNSINYKYRMHDPRIGRFLSIDPLASDFAWNSPYSFSLNRVIDGIELEGLEFIYHTESMIDILYNGTVEIRLSNFSKAYQKQWIMRDSYYKKHNLVYTDPNGKEFIGGYPKTIGSYAMPFQNDLLAFLITNKILSGSYVNDFSESNQKALESTRFTNNGKLDLRFNGTKTVLQNAGIARGLVALEIMRLGYIGYSGYKEAFWDCPNKLTDISKLDKQLDLLKKAQDAVNKYLKENSIDPDLMSGENGTNLLKYVFSGEKAGNNEQVFELGNEILEAINQVIFENAEDIPENLESGNKSNSSTPADNTIVR